MCVDMLINLGKSTLPKQFNDLIGIPNTMVYWHIHYTHKQINVHCYRPIEFSLHSWQATRTKKIQLQCRFGMKLLLLLLVAVFGLKFSLFTRRTLLETSPRKTKETNVHKWQELSVWTRYIDGTANARAAIGATETKTKSKRTTQHIHR